MNTFVQKLVETCALVRAQAVIATEKAERVRLNALADTLAAEARAQKQKGKTEWFKEKYCLRRVS
jgi:hypothetical protein